MMTMKYTLDDFTNIAFSGFSYKLPDETISIINDIASQVGSPSYIRTPIFQKKEQVVNNNGGSSSSSSRFGECVNKGDEMNIYKKKKRGFKNQEIVDDSEWAAIRSFTATKIEPKEGIIVQIDLIRSHLNKMTEKNYTDQAENIMNVLKHVLESSSIEEDVMRVGNAIFEIASNNRFYSKLYADLYTLLIKKFELMETIFENNLRTYLGIFENIEHGNSNEDYDKFCKINKDNEKRKSLSSFFVNLTLNEVISIEKLKGLLCTLMNTLVLFVSQDNKKNEVDELIENIFILYNKDWMADCSIDICGDTFMNHVVKFAHSKAKTYPSLSNKTIFKFMDMIEM